MSDPHVGGAVMFGRSRFNVGVLVSPSQDLIFSPNDERKLTEYRDLLSLVIWCTITCLRS